MTKHWGPEWAGPPPIKMNFITKGNLYKYINGENLSHVFLILHKLPREYHLPLCGRMDGLRGRDQPSPIYSLGRDCHVPLRPSLSGRDVVPL